MNGKHSKGLWTPLSASRNGRTCSRRMTLSRQASRIGGRMGDAIALLRDPANRDIVGWIIAVYLIWLIDRRLSRMNREIAKYTQLLTVHMGHQTSRMQEIRDAILWLVSGPRQRRGSDSERGEQHHGGDQGSFP